MQTIGERLEEARKRKGISIREAAEATKIRSDYLQKFESNQFDFNLAELYVRGFLRSYAQFLKLPADRIVNDFNALGIGSRPRTPSREIYGRMDLSVATADGGEAGNDSPAPGQDAAAAATRRQPAPFARTGTSLPPTPLLDPNLVIKGSIGLIVAIVGALLLWGAYSLFKDDTPPATANPASNPGVETPPPAATQNWLLVAIAPTDVTVYRQNADGSRIVVYQGSMGQGRTYPLPRGRGHLVVPSVPGAIEVEYQGVRVGRGPDVSDPRGFMLQ